MTRLILTTSDSGAGGLAGARLADCVIPVGPRFVCGRLPSKIDLETWLSPRSESHQNPGSHWLDHTGKRLDAVRTEGPGLIEFCNRFDAIGLWIDPDPNAQLVLVWLLDHLRHHADIALKLKLVQADVPIGNHPPEELATWRLPAVKILNDHLQTASTAWQAYRAATPQDWFNLLGKDLSVLPQLWRWDLENRALIAP